MDPLRKRVLDAAGDFFAATQASPAFVPGKSYIPATAKSLDGADLLQLIDASLDLWLTAGRFTQEFEARLAKRVGRAVPALMVNSGSSANLVALSSLKLEKGAEVITAAAGFPTTVNPIVQNGWVPVFVDVDRDTLNATPEAVMAARGPRTRAVVLAHALGNPFRADVLADWCRKEGLLLVEDCCDALGATIDGRPAGSFGDCSTLSFYPAHQITTGEGGAVLARDGAFRKVAESFRDWGRDCWCDPGKDGTCGKRFGWKLGGLPCGYDHKYIYSNVGYNLKATDMQAAIGLSQLDKLERFLAVRRANWKKLEAGIHSSPVLRERLFPARATPLTEPSWFGFSLRCAPGIHREKLVPFLESRGIGTRLLFAGNLTKQPAYQDVSYRVSGSLEVTDELMERLFWIGVHPALGDTQIAYMLEQLEAGVRAQ